MSTGIVKKYTCTDETESICINKLSKLTLNRLIPPTDMVLKKKNLAKAYSLVLPTDGKSGTYTDMKKEILVSELRLVRADFTQLSEENLSFETLDADNVLIVGDKIFIYDYRKLSKSLDGEYARTYNNVKLNELFGLKLLAAENPHVDRFSTFDKFYTEFLSTNNDYLEDYIENEVKEDTLGKHILKR